MTTPILWHFRFSHFNEKARWALDWKQVPHRRRAVAPGPHVQTIVEVSGQPQVPVLEWDGRVIPDTTAIIAALEAAQPAPALLPADPAARARALALEDDLDETLGPDVRRLGFDAMLDDAPFCLELFSEGVTPDPRPFYETAFPMVREVIRTSLGVDAAGVAESAARVAAWLDRLDAERAGRDHLVGDAFSVADLTAAALLSPLLRPAEFPYPEPPSPPAQMLALRARWADHPTMRWAAETYRRHRGTSAEVAG